MKITVISVGRIKEKYFKSAIEEYTKRLGKFCNIEIVEIENEKILDNQLSNKYKDREGERILSYFKPGMKIFALEVKGKMFDSIEFSQQIASTFDRGISHIAFVIGGANGLSEKVLSKSDNRISFSRMTFTHQMMRLILLEQIYRAFKIINNEIYHR